MVVKDYGARSVHARGDSAFQQLAEGPRARGTVDLVYRDIGARNISPESRVAGRDNFHAYSRVGGCNMPAERGDRAGRPAGRNAEAADGMNDSHGR